MFDDLREKHLSKKMTKTDVISLLGKPDLAEKEAHFSYNLGNGTFCGPIAGLLNAGKVKEACQRLTLYNKARKNGVLIELPGLTKRRALEQMYCLKGA